MPGIAVLPKTSGGGSTSTAGTPTALSAYGVNLTPPAPVSYSLGGNLGDISNVISQVNQAQNQANAANNQRYTQQLQTLGAGANGLNTMSANAIKAAQGGYSAGIQQLAGGLAGNNTIIQNDINRLQQQTQNDSAASRQSAISRGLGNTSILDTLQGGVTRRANDAYANLAAKKAELDNDIYKNIANMDVGSGTTQANLINQAGSNYFGGANSIANAIAARNDVGPQIGDYAGLIQAASAAQNSGGKTTITNTVPDTSELGRRINNPGSTGGLSGGIQSSMGGGGFTSGGGSQLGGGGGGGGGTTSNGGLYYAGPDAGKQSTYTPPTMAPVAPITVSGNATPGSNYPGFVTPEAEQALTQDANANAQAAQVPPGMKVISGSGPGIDAITGQWSPFARMLVPA